MSCDSGYLDQVLEFLRTQEGAQPLDAMEGLSTSEEDDETIEEPDIDDRPKSPMSLEQIFETFELPSDSSESSEALESLIPGPPSSADTFASFFSRLGIRNFSPSELLVLGGNNANGPCKGQNYIPAKRLWPRIAPTIVALDTIRDRLGYGVHITNAYRSPEYNACLATISEGVAKFSQHIEFRAIDFKGASGSPADWHREVKQFASRKPSFGIWTKRYNTFVHIDTRGAT
jgi:hypothetical protein